MGISNLPDLNEGAFELRESVTIADAKGTRVEARKGDVVTLGDLEATQELVGAKVRVYRVTAATIEELHNIGCVK